MLTSIHYVRAELLLAEQAGGMLPASLIHGSWYATDDDALLAFLSFREYDATWMFAVLAHEDRGRYRLVHGGYGFKSFDEAKAALDVVKTDELLSKVRAA